jgi:arginase family enzyme
MPAAIGLGEEIARRCGGSTHRVGAAEPVVAGGWRVQLREALPGLRLLSADLENRLEAQEPVFTVAGRCAASLATLPVIARRHPETAIVWLDAHGDSNVPSDQPSSEIAYLGGMVLSGAAGEWTTGLGGDLEFSQVILVGGRDLDPPEKARVAAGQLCLVEAGPNLGKRLLAAVGNRSVYVHLDCDVLDAGLLPTEYQVPNGFSYEELREACEALCQRKLIGLEISEYEGEWPDGTVGSPDRLIEAIAPLLEK